MTKKSVMNEFQSTDCILSHIPEELNSSKLDVDKMSVPQMSVPQMREDPKNAIIQMTCLLLLFFMVVFVFCSIIYLMVKSLITLNS